MSDSDAIRRALGGFPDKEKQSDNANIRNALDDYFYADLNNTYRLPYPNTATTTKPPPKTVTPPKQTTPAIPTGSKVLASPAPTQPNSVASMLQGIQDNIAGGQQWAGQTFNFDPNVENVIGAGAGIANMLGGVIGGGLAKVGEGANVLDEVLARNPRTGALPAGYKPFTEQVADLAGQYNERIQEPLAGIGAQLYRESGGAPFNPVNQNFGQIFEDTLKGDWNAALFGRPQVQTAKPAPSLFPAVSASLAQLAAGNVNGALTSINRYGNAQYDALDAGDQFAASLLFDPLNFVPGLGIGKINKAGKLAGALEDVGKVDDVAKLLPKSRFTTDAAKLTQTVKDAVSHLFQRTVDADADTLFNTTRAYMRAGEAGQFDEIAKAYGGLKTLPGNRLRVLTQGMGKIVDDLEAGYRAADTALAGGAVDAKTLPKTYARFLDDVKGGRIAPANAANELLDLTKAEMYSQAQKFMAKEGAKWLPKRNLNAPTNIAQRFLNNVKAAEALAYIGLSPFTFMRNFVNGVTTMAIEGLNPLWDAGAEVARLQKLGQPEKAAALKRAISFQKTMTRTGDVSRAALGQGGDYSTAMTGSFGSFMSKMLHKTKLGTSLDWYRHMEESQRAQVWTQTYWKAVSSNWDAGKWIPVPDAGTEVALRMYGVDPRKLTDVIRESGPNANQINKNVMAWMRGQRGNALDYDGWAKEMGITREQLTAFLDEADVVKANQMGQEIAARVMQGEDKAAVVDEVVAREATQTAQAVEQKLNLTEIGQDGLPTRAAGVDDAQLKSRLNELAQQQEQLDNELNTLRGSKNKNKIERRKEIAAQMDEISNERTELQEALGLTDEEILFGSNPAFPEPPPGAKVKTPDVKRPQGMTVQQYVDDYMAGKGRGNTPADLEYQQFAANNAQEIEREFQARAVKPPLESDLPPVDFPEQVLSQGQQNARDFLMGIKRADGTPVYTEQQLATWKPETLETVAGELQTYRNTFDDIMRTAKEHGVPTATEKGAPNNRNLINVLNKHRGSAARFENIDDVRARADEAVEILNNYTPSVKEPKAVPVKKNVPAEPKPEPVAATSPDVGAVDSGNAVTAGEASSIPSITSNSPSNSPSSLPIDTSTAQAAKKSKSVKYDKKSLPDAIRAAKETGYDKDVYIFATNNGFVIHNEPPPGWQKAVVVRPDGTSGVYVNRPSMSDVQDAIANESNVAHPPSAPAAQGAGQIPDEFASEVERLQWHYDKARATLKKLKSTPNKNADIMRQIDFYEKQSKGLGFQLSAAKKKAAKGVGNASDSQLRGIDPDEMHTAGRPPQQRMNAADAIENLRTVAQEDEAAARILSRDEMVKANARKQADLLEALWNLWNKEEIKRMRLGTDAEAKVAGYLRRDVLPRADESRQAAQVMADWMDNAVMISRDGETKFDTALGVLAPFQFWRSRFALQSLRRVADKPARLAWYLKIREGQDQVQDDPRFPKRLRGMMRFPLLGAPAWAGGGMWYDPLEILTAQESVWGANQFEDTVTDNEVAQAITALAQSGEIPLEQATQAKANMSGALWEQTKTQLESLAKSGQGIDSFADMFRPHLPLDIIWKIKTGNAKDIGVLFPATRLIKAATGANIEQPVKAGLRSITGQKDIPDWDQWEEGRTDKALADLVGDGTITERDALIALIERRGPVFEQAKQRAAEKASMQTFSVFGGQLFPSGEQAYYKATNERSKLLDEAVASLGANPADYTTGEKWELVKANGLSKRGTPLGDFYDKNPVYGARQNIYDVPEKQLKTLLVDQIWDEYNKNGKLDKKLMAQQLGEDFQSRMLNSETRDMENVTLDQLGEWARRIRAYIPQQDMLKVGDFPQVQYGTLDQNERYNGMMGTRDQLFNMDTVGPKLDMYHSLDKDSAYAYRNTDAELDAYLDWYRDSMRANPDIAKLINPDYQASTGAYVNTRDGANDVTRYTVQNLENMIRRIGGRQGRGGGGGGGVPAPVAPTGKPAVLSKKAKQALAQRQRNPKYYIPRDVFEELLAYFRASGARGGFQNWLDAMVMGGMY